MILIIFSELFLIFLSSRYITQSLFSLLSLITHSKRAAVFFVTLLFFPGTVIHELSHFLMAHLLFLQTGEFSLFPHLQGDHLKLGSVQVEKTDFIRSFFVGAAPIFWGIGVLVGIVWYVQQYGMKLPFISQYFAVAIILGYAFFVIANSMFSSRKDFESMWKLLVLLGILFVMYFLIVGQRNIVHELNDIRNNPIAKSVSSMLSRVLIVPTVINILLTGIFFVIRKRV